MTGEAMNSDGAFDRWLDAQEDEHMEREKQDAEMSGICPVRMTKHQPCRSTPQYSVTELHMPLVVPGWANWLAIDSNGSVWAFEYKPVAGKDCWDLGPEERNYRRAMVAESGWWWVDDTSVPDVLAGWRTMLYPVPANG